MEVQILKYPTAEDWILCRKCTLTTVGKDANTEPSFAWKQKLLRARHSPIRVLPFCFKITDVPYWVSVHLCRHIHSQPFVKTQRNDRQSDYDRKKAPQDAPVDMCWYMTAEELMTVANKRLCNMASPETREVVEMICNKVVEVSPEFDGMFEPMCYYRGGRCDEFNCCGFNETYKEGFTD